jgi:excisionase family DNA binding protein
MADVIGAREAAHMLGVDRSWVLKLAREGVLESTKLPGRTGSYVFIRAEVERYMVALATARDADNETRVAS